MIDPRRRAVLFVHCVAASLAFASLFAVGQADTPLSSRQAERMKDVDPSKLQIKSDMRLGADQLARAGTIQAVEKDRIVALLPENLGAFSKATADGYTRAFGPMTVTVVKAAYEADGGARLALEVTDPGGMPAEGEYYLPMLPDGVEAPGDNVSFLGQAAAGFDGTLKTDRGKGVAIYQVALGPRLRLTIQSDLERADTLRDAASLVDLAALAALAPEPPPSLAEEGDE